MFKFLVAVGVLGFAPPMQRVRPDRVCARRPLNDWFVDEPFFDDFVIVKRQPSFNWVAPVASFAFFLAFPGFVFKLVGLALVVVFAGPPLVAYGLRQWAAANTADCPRCGSAIDRPNINDQTVCMHCGTSLVATTNGKSWRPRSIYDDAVASQGVVDVDFTTGDE